MQALEEVSMGENFLDINAVQELRLMSSVKKFFYNDKRMDAPIPHF